MNINIGVSRENPILITAAVGLLIGLGFLLVDPWIIISAFVAVGAISIAAISYPWLVAILLVVRTCIDAPAQEYVYVMGMRVSPAAVFSLAMTVLISWAFFATRASIPWSEGTRALSLLLLGALMGTLNAYSYLGADGNVALREFVRLSMLFVWYVFVYERTKALGVTEPFFRAILLACPVPIVVGVFDLLVGTKFDAEGATRIASTFPGPNSYGTYLVFLILFAFARILARKDWKGWVVLAVALPSLLFTYSRGAWTSLMVAAPVFWFFSSKHRSKLGLVILAAVLLSYPIIVSRISAVDYGDVLQEAQTGVTSNSFSFRVVIWSELLTMWKQKPILGWGLGTTPLLNPIRLPFENRGFAAHNDFVRNLFETGLLGFSFYLTYLWVLGRGLLNRVRAFRGSDLEPYAVMGLAVFLGMLVNSLTVSDPILESTFMFHFLGLVAVLEAAGDKAGALAERPLR